MNETTQVSTDVHIEHGCAKEDMSRMDPLNLFKVTVLDTIQHMIEELVENPGRLKFCYSVSPNTDSNSRSTNRASLTIHIPEEEMGKVLGKQMRVYNAIKTIGFSVASKNGFYLAMQIHQTYRKNRDAD